MLTTFPNANINVELKLDDSPTADLLADTLKRFNAAGRVLVGSRHCGALRHFRSISPEVPTSACESEGFAFVVLSLLRLQRLWPLLVPAPRPNALQIPHRSGGLNLGQALYVDAAHSLGLKVWSCFSPLSLPLSLALSLSHTHAHTLSPYLSLVSSFLFFVWCVCCSVAVFAGLDC